MAYKPKVVQTGGFGPRGVANVLISKDKSKVKASMRDKDGKVTDYLLKKEDCPEYVQSGEFSVSLSSDGKKMFGMYPVQGMFTGKVEKFIAEEGKDPTPRTNETYGYQYFTVLVRIVSPKQYRGMIVPFFMRYHFDTINDEVKGKTFEVIGISHPKSKYTALLMDWLEAVGAWDNGPMKYKANILPDLAKRIALANKSFQFVLKDGYVTTVFSMGSESKEEEETDVSEPEPEVFDTPDVEETDDDEIPWD